MTLSAEVRPHLESCLHGEGSPGTNEKQLPEKLPPECEMLLVLTRPARNCEVCFDGFSTETAKLEPSMWTFPLKKEGRWLWELGQPLLDLWALLGHMFCCFCKSGSLAVTQGL